ncbi:MAG TPA: NAD(P)H-dependent oxidoreductase [Xanthobacteraceae bacterium]|nr:NAD(P)H-dependent oxidoreductase [Xanthobacteraceae bacterium]
MAKQNVLVICGSLRNGSLNKSVARTLPELAPAGMTLSDAPPYDDFTIYNADHHQATVFPPPVVMFADAIRAADGVIIVSPEYNWSVPGGLKNAIDWVSRMKEQPFREKPVALQSASGGPLGAARMQYHLRQILTSIDAFVFMRPEIFVTFAPQKIDEKAGKLKDEPTREIIKTQLVAFAKFIERVRPKS